MKNMTFKKWIALILKVLLAAVVAVFFGSESLNFFTFVFPPDQPLLVYAGFGLTMGSMVVYLYLLLNDADTSLKRTIAFIMAIAGLVGELATAGFGMQIEGWKKMGWTLTETDFGSMITVVRIMLLFHGVALLSYWSGDRVIELLKDDDRDGIPNYKDKDYQKPARVPANDSQKPQNERSNNSRPQTPPPPQHTLDEFLQASGLSREEARKRFADRQAFMSFASNQFDYISGGNMKRMHDELTTNPQTAARSNGSR